ncbi:MAG: nucleoside transporter C-terminal domain-containing protein [Bacteroidales bacterium]|nr:nucleoside transporter C-terminal domain-containing protein [Bacteroidales bacterium]
MFQFLKSLKFVNGKKVLMIVLVIFSLAIISIGASVVWAKNAPQNDTSLVLTDSITAIEMASETAETVEPVNDALIDKSALLLKNAKPNFSWNALGRGLLGITFLLVVAWLLSKNRKAISWKTVLVALGLQIVLAIGILYVPFIESFFMIAGKIFVKILEFTKVGTTFLFGEYFMNPNNVGYVFVFQVLPTIIFFSAITSLLFYLGVIQVVVKGLAWVFTRLMRISGIESLSLAGNIFLGQTEAPLLVKAYISKVSPSQLFLVMTGGMATIAGGVLAAYIGLLGGDDPVLQQQFAKHLISASVMAAPGAVVMAKMLFPETDSVDMSLKVDKSSMGANVLDAFSEGTVQGVKLAVNVAGMLLTFLAFIALTNYVLEGMIGRWTGLNEWIQTISGGKFSGFSLQFIMGYACAPVMWLLGVATPDLVLVGQLFGEKTILNEFVAYLSLNDMKMAGVFTSTKSIIIATYLLCGFANVGSIGIQIGGIGALAPNRRGELSKFGFRALLAAAMTAMLSATIIGTIMG